MTFLFLEVKKNIKIMWARALWIEGSKMMEDTIPYKWIDTKTKIVYWPKSNYVKCLKDQEEPNETWKNFKLIKIKVIDGKYFCNFFIANI